MFRQKGGKTNINILNKMQRIKDFRLHIKNFLEKIAKLKVLSQVMVNSWLTPGYVYEKSREDPETGFVIG